MIAWKLGISKVFFYSCPVIHCSCICVGPPKGGVLNRIQRCPWHWLKQATKKGAGGRAQKGLQDKTFYEGIIIWVVVLDILYFHPYLGKISILTNIFQRGWNHQPVMFAVPFFPSMQVCEKPGSVQKLASCDAALKSYHFFLAEFS